MAAQIKALCITEDPDRPTTATFVGLKEAGVDVTVVCPQGERREWLESRGVRIFDLPLRRQFDREAVRLLRAEVLQGRYDVLHLFSNKALQTGLAASRGLPVKIVAYRGIVGNVSFFSPISWLRFLNPRIDRIVCVADAVRNYFLAMRPAFLRVPPERLVTIYKGHSLEWYRAAPADLTTLGVPRGAFAIACVANYRPRKGIEVLVEAFGELPDDAHLLLIGGEMDAPQNRRESRGGAHSRSGLPARRARVDGRVQPVRPAVDEARRVGPLVDRGDGLRDRARRDRLRGEPRARSTRPKRARGAGVRRGSSRGGHAHAAR
jgi:glycosyltransferase involved in cell wall biosynthesis